MLGDELSRESQFLLHAAQMSLAVAPAVYAIAQGEASGYRQYCYFITATSGKNLLVGCPRYNEDLAEALDALGGIDSILLLGDSSNVELWTYEFACDTIGKGGPPSQSPLTADLTLLRLPDLALLYHEQGGILCCGDLLTIEASGKLRPNAAAATLAKLKPLAISAILPSRTKAGFITEGGTSLLAKVWHDER